MAHYPSLIHISSNPTKVIPPVPEFLLPVMALGNVLPGSRHNAASSNGSEPCIRAGAVTIARASDDILVEASCLATSRRMSARNARSVREAMEREGRKLEWMLHFSA